MKILHISSYYATGSFYKNLFDRQVQRGLTVQVFLPVQKGSAPLVGMGDYTAVREAFGKWDKLWFFRKQKRIYKTLFQAMGPLDVDLVHAHSLFTNGYSALRLKQTKGIPYIVAVRSTDLVSFFKLQPHLRKIGLKIMEQAEGIVFLSGNLRDQVLRYVPKPLHEAFLKKTHIIPNGIDDFWLKEVPAVRTHPQSPLGILSVGQLNAKKNFQGTMEAVEKLVRKGVPVRLHVAGPVVDASVKSLLQGKSFVEYHGVLDKARLKDLYGQTDIFLLPSRQETFGLVYAEAMSQGLPVIYTRGQGFDKQFPDGRVGYPVDCDDTDAMADTILKVRDQYAVLTKNVIADSKRFDWTLIEEQYHGIYEEILGQGVKKGMEKGGDEDVAEGG